LRANLSRIVIDLNWLVSTFKHTNLVCCESMKPSHLSRFIFKRCETNFMIHKLSINNCQLSDHLTLDFSMFIFKYFKVSVFCWWTMNRSSFGISGVQNYGKIDYLPGYLRTIPWLHPWIQRNAFHYFTLFIQLFRASLTTHCIFAHILSWLKFLIPKFL